MRPPTPATPIGRLDAAAGSGTATFAPGRLLADRYRIIGLLGRGGMGEVYRAEDLKLGQPVSLKFLPPSLARNASFLQRFHAEVRNARQVSHPNVCRVYDIGEIDGHHFISMEYVDGEDLASLLRRIGRLPKGKADQVARQLCAGLAAAHDKGVLHRDLKPSNVMLDGRGRVRITDFGLAVGPGEASKGEVAGTPAYMAPEQFDGEAVTVQSDLYSLGLILYEIYVGQRAFEASSFAEWKSRHGTTLPPSPAQVEPDIGAAAERVIMRCLEKEPSRRPGSALQIAAALGDPLAAALAAGETPSPEMVAAAGEEGSLSTAKAWGLFGLALIAGAAAIFFAASTTGLDQVPITRSPELLCERAREIVQLVGGDAPSRSVEWWLDLDDGYAEWSLSQPSAPSLADARPSAIRFNYRQSPEPILPTERLLPTRRDPAPTWSGEWYIALDPRGGLLEFSRLARQVAPSDSGRAAPIEWSPILALTGVDMHGLQSVEPLWTPDVPCDARAAWITNGGQQPIRLEAAAWNGQPVWLRTIAPWVRAERDSPARPRGYVGFTFFVALVAATVLAFGALARHNLRLGRSDRRGAVRTAAAVFVCFALWNTLLFRWAVDPLHVWQWMYRQPFLPTLSAWLYYLGVEPFLRRHWPHRLIAWTRLLEGRFADPLVGREVLIGLLAGTGMILASCMQPALERRADVGLLVLTLGLGRAADFWGSIANALGNAMMFGLGAFALLLLLRALFRRDAVAWVALVLVFAAINVPSSDFSEVQWIGIAASAACFVLAVRVGLVAAIVAAAVSNLLTYCGPMTLDMSRWYAWRTGVVAVLLLAIAVWGFRAVMGRRKILPAAMLEG